MGFGILLLLSLATIQRNKLYADESLLWRDTVEKVPANARAHSNYANTLTADPATCGQAIHHCRLAIAINPDYAPAYNNLGYALAKLRRFEEALPYYDKALAFRRKLDLEVILCNRATALTHLNRHAEAEADFRASLAIRPDNEEALNNYGNLLHNLGRYREAIHCFDRALALDPAFASAWSNRGNAFSARGLDRAEALRSYQRAAALDPTLWEAQDNTGRYLMALNRPADAVPYFRAALRAKPPDEALSRYRLANALMLSGDEAACIPEYKKVTELLPDFFGAHHNLALALANTGKIDEALPHFEAALRLEPAAAPVHLNYAGALARAGRVQEAITRAREALRLDPTLAPARELLSKLTRQ